MKKKKTILLLVIGILIIITLSLRVTYSYMKAKVEKGENTNITVSTCAKIQLKDNGNSINLENTYPMDDSMGLETKPYEFAISSTCEDYVGFNLYLTSLNDNQIEDSNIHFAITNKNKTILSEGILNNQEKSENDFSTEELKELDIGIKGIHKNIYKILSKAMPLKGESTYQLYLWVDKDATNETMGKSFRVGLSIKSYERENNLAVDLSNNGFDGEFKNGATIKKDDENNVGLYLDGENDYVDIVDLPETIDWANGFTIEFEAKWLNLNYWSRVIDFGNGPDADNILIGNVNDTPNLMASLRIGNSAFPHEKIFNDMIEVNKKDNYKFVYQKNNNGYEETLYKNNLLIENVSYELTDTIKNIKRTENYIGKSNWEVYDVDKNFCGYIFFLKITDSKNDLIIYYDFSK